MKLKVIILIVLHVNNLQRENYLMMNLNSEWVEKLDEDFIKLQKIIGGK